jgi:nucleoid DNA-binding protein
MTLSKDAIISAVAKANGYHRPQATQLIETLLEIIKFKLDELVKS